MPGIPRITFSDESQVFLGGKEVLAHYLGRGHTNGDAMIYFPSERVLHTGDLFTNGAPFCDTTAHCSIKEWDGTLKKALHFDFDTVIPGHGPVMKKAGPGEVCEIDRHHSRSVEESLRGRRGRCGKRLDLADLGWTTGGIFGRGIPGMCAELAQ